jgi:predicted deacylase
MWRDCFEGSAENKSMLDTLANGLSTTRSEIDGLLCSNRPKRYIKPSGGWLLSSVSRNFSEIKTRM